MIRKDYSKVTELHNRAFQVHKPGKNQAIDIIESMASEHDNGELPSELVRLYAYFNGRPKAPKRAKTAFDWVAQAVSTDDTRQHMQVVQVEENRIAATDGKRLHIASNPDGLEPGKYRADGVRLCSLDSTDCGTFPNIDCVIPDDAPDCRFTVQPAKLEAEPRSNRTILEPDGINKIAFNRQYLEQAALEGSDILIESKGPEKAAKVRPVNQPKGWDCVAIIMPMLQD